MATLFPFLFGSSRYPRVCHVEIGRVALQVVDAHPVVHEVPPAGGLALAHADAAADEGQGVFLLDEPYRVPVAAHRHEGDVALHVDTGGAGLACRAQAVGVMVGEEQLEGRSSSTP